MNDRRRGASKLPEMTAAADAIGPAPEPNPPDSLDRLLRLESARRARTRWIVVAILCVVAGVAAALWWTTRSRLPDPPQKTLESVRAVMPKINSMRPEVRIALAGEAIAELEVDRLPAKLREPFAQFQQVMPEMVSLVAMRALSDPTVLPIWTRACGSGLTGIDALADMQTLPREQQAQALWERCNLARYDFLSQHEIEGSSAPLLALAYSVYEELRSKKALLSEEESLLRVLVVSSQ